MTNSGYDPQTELERLFVVLTMLRRQVSWLGVGPSRASSIVYDYFAFKTRPAAVCVFLTCSLLLPILESLSIGGQLI